ncbi:MAG: thioredoxin family protein, partial [Planctomycetaceae bacterium]
GSKNARNIQPLALDAATENAQQVDARSRFQPQPEKKQPEKKQPEKKQLRVQSGQAAGSAAAKPATEFKKTGRTGAEAGRTTQQKPLKRRVIVVKAKWCGACRLLDSEWPKLRAVRWRIGVRDTQHFQLIDVDADPGVVVRYGITQLPTLLLIENGKILSRAGGLNAKDLAEFYYGRL